MDARPPFTVALVGRPNVGKSTLFNRLVGKRLAIVDDTPGVTRDWKAASASLSDMDIRVLDTAGLEEANVESLQGRMVAATEQALGLSDVALFLIDARAGLTPLDHHFADLLRRRSVPVIVIANKTEGSVAEAEGLEAYALGLGDPVMMSGEHGLGMADLIEALGPHYDAWRARSADPEGATDNGDIPLPEEGEEEPEDPEKPISLAIVGRPNAGKSTLLNTLIGQQRSLVGPEPGVTRDSVSVDWEYKGRKFRLVDTAGLRRKSRISDRLELLSVAATLRVIRLAQVVILVIDGQSILDKQDLTIARHVVNEGRILIIAVNKWDIVTDKQEAIKRLADRLEISLPQVRGLPTITLSALTGQRVDRLLDEVLAVHPIWCKRVGTGHLNRWLNALTQAHPPPMVRGRPNRIRYMSQINSRPPTFALWCGHPHDLPEAYIRYVTNGLRDDFGFVGVPVRVLTRGSENPYADKSA